MANEVNYFIDKGSNVTLSFTNSHSNGSLKDLSTYTVASKIKKNPYTNTAYSFVCVGYANGLITLSMNSAYSNTVPDGIYLYDVEITSNTGVVERVQEGLMTVNPNIT